MAIVRFIVGDSSTARSGHSIGESDRDPRDSDAVPRVLANGTSSARYRTGNGDR